jgi:hypothetical protein
VATEFTGRTAEMRVDTPWLAAEDLLGIPGNEAKVTISGVFEHSNVEFAEGRKKAKAFAVAFSGKQKQLVLNTTNRKALVSLYGPNVIEWKNKPCTLFVSEAKLKGQVVPCIRIKG